MEKKFTIRYIRISPRKARIVINQIKGRSVGEALEILQFVRKAAAKPLTKMLESAVSALKATDPTIDVDGIFIKSGWVDQGPALKRRRPRARGYATLIKKYLSHFNIVISDEK